MTLQELMGWKRSPRAQHLLPAPISRQRFHTNSTLDKIYGTEKVRTTLFPVSTAGLCELGGVVFCRVGERVSGLNRGMTLIDRQLVREQVFNKGEARFIGMKRA
jgi:hypothetical protein